MAQDFSEILKKINPKISDKYSPNLFRFLRGKGRDCTTIFKDPDGVLYIGHRESDGMVFGNRLSQVLCFGVRSQTYGYLGSSKKWREVKSFWAEYIKIGRCALDHEHKTHFQSQDSRYTQVSKTVRQCRWCGARLKRKIVIEKRKVETWNVIE